LAKFPQKLIKFTFEKHILQIFSKTFVEIRTIFVRKKITNEKLALETYKFVRERIRLRDVHI